MPEKTYEDGVAEGVTRGKLEEIEKRQADVEEALKAIPTTITGLGDSLRQDFNDHLAPISKALLGNGNPKEGLAARFEALSSTVKGNWGLTLLMLTAIIAIAIKIVFA